MFTKLVNVCVPSTFLVSNCDRVRSNEVDLRYSNLRYHNYTRSTILNYLYHLKSILKRAYCTVNLPHQVKKGKIIKGTLGFKIGRSGEPSRPEEKDGPIGSQDCRRDKTEQRILR